MAETTTSRSRGLLLLAAGALTFVGTTVHWLPYEAFFPAVAVCGLGVLLFMKDNRRVTEQEEARIRRSLDPQIRNHSMERFAARQAEVDGRALESLATLEGRRAPAEPVAPVAVPVRDEIVLTDVSETEPVAAPDAETDDAGFVVSTDVSFPVELQLSQSLAEQLQKLDRLRADGVISDEEFAVAKAKLLG